MSVTLDRLITWLATPSETEHLEFKEAKTQYSSIKLFKYCVALANEGGGHLILGVTDKPPRRVVGSQAFQNLEEIRAKLVSKLQIRVEVDELHHPDGRVLIFSVPARPKGAPLHIDGQYLMRAGEELVPMTADRLQAIFAEGQSNFEERIALGGLAAADVVRLLDSQSYFDLVRLPYPVDRQGVLERFSRERLIVKKGDRFSITNLGALLFAKDLGEFDLLSRKSVRVTTYEGLDKLTTLRDITGVKGYAVGYERLVDYVNSQIPANEVIGKALRESVPMYPEIAIRELVANALIHQDLEQTGGSVAIDIYANRLEISNPGVPCIEPDRFIDEYRSRNDRLTDLMRRLRICEEKGSGIDKVISSVEDYQLPPLDIRVGQARTTVVLFGHRSFNDMDRADKVRACYQHCSLRYVMTEKMTNQSLRERFALSTRQVDTASRIIRDTMDEGLIKLEDPQSSSKRYAKYIPYWA
ncbi:MAG: putative DNA binding domain-containing protein [Desulfobulbaceae bacterium]|nr:putative DNA binding domain-containing protein [Desulfobulbaceae bacterium]HIJ91585.1 MloB [Deltaproteobacteria bacterium]